jgi:hypothetical protein
MQNSPPHKETTQPKNKKIPAKYREVVLEALSYYPELRETHIDVVLKNKHPVPYGTTPSIKSLLIPGAPRKYIITLREEAPEPIYQALFKNLPRECQVAVIGHELGHVIQYEKRSVAELMKLSVQLLTEEKKRKVERGADIKAIEHGLGKELYAHAVYIRNIKGYVEKRKEIELYYLKPHEILQGVSEKETGVGV